jgi:scaffold protein (connect acetoacetyl-CoA thiolase and HMG-CoA synthase)
MSTGETKMTAQRPFTIEQFYKNLALGKLTAGKCQKCGKIHLPPRPMCSNCFSQEFEWVEVPGKGRLITYTVIHIAPQQFQTIAPYPVGIVELENGLRIPGMMQGVTQEKLQIGMELIIDYDVCSTIQAWPEWPRYCFKPS